MNALYDDQRVTKKWDYSVQNPCLGLLDSMQYIFREL